MSAIAKKACRASRGHFPEREEGLIKNSTCAFVVSTGRVGMQTLATILNLAPEIEAYQGPNPRLLKTPQDAYGLPGRCSQWSPQQHDTLAKLCGATLRHLGYQL